MVVGVSWVGVRTDDVEQSAAFFGDVLGLSRVIAREDFMVLDAPNGDRLELFGPSGPQPSHQFSRNQVMVGFAVPNLSAARRKLVGAGVELLGDPASCPTWQHFKGPDGLVYEINEPKG